MGEPSGGVLRTWSGGGGGGSSAALTAELLMIGGMQNVLISPEASAFAANSSGSLVKGRGVSFALDGG